MEAVSLTGVLWAVVLVLPAVLATALCIGCRDTGSPGAEWARSPLPPPLTLCPALSPAHGAQAVGDYEYKPPPCVPPNSFMVLTRANSRPFPPGHPHPEQFLSIPRSPQAPQSRQVSLTRTETDNDSVPSYENEERPRGDDDDNDYNNEIYIPGYVEVLPDSVTEASPTELVTSGPELRDSVSSVAMGDEYENMPEAQRESLADSLEYVNMPEPGSSLPDAHYGASDRESEDDGPDYENLHR
ncbi:linker for activation of T-cells family member 1 [Chelonoidis abingdonii]|uniref:linker for activation of T-cells family member 1 n=1 Tax=Chelonoidis abingdonii TaxID=106734 RepID=UPI003F490BF4